jgi:GR25 family glycosyltransferase involved in LPS biosynthesis
MIVDISKSKNFLINLETDKQRLTESSNELKKLNIPFDRFDAVKHTKGIVGCGMSHFNLLNQSKNLISTNNIFILEDDVQLTTLNNDLIFEIPDNTDALYLGISRFGFVPRVNVGIFDSVFSCDVDKNYKRVFNMCSTHAIVYLSQRYVDAVLNTIDFCLKNDIAFDLGIASIHKNFNILTPKNPMFFQKDQAEATRFILS